MARAEIRLTYGLDNDGRMVHILDARNGSACQCFCPECRAPLVARQGVKREWHFAHLSGHGSVSCETARETALHKMAKQVICDNLRVFLPRLEAVVYGTVHVLAEPAVIMLSEAASEIRYGDIIPDLAVKDHSVRTYFVEIFVTHAVGADKYPKLERIGVPTVEINLSSVDPDIWPDELEELLCQGTKPELFRWAWHPDKENFIKSETARLDEINRDKAEKRRAAAAARAAASKTRRAEYDKAVERLRERQAEANRKKFESDAKKAALDAVMAKIEADRKARAEAERQARIAKADQERSEYRALGDDVQKLLYHKWCPACGSVMREHGDGSYACPSCGRVYGIDHDRASFELDPGQHVCPQCGSGMCLRNGRNGRFWGCSRFPACRGTARYEGHY